MKCREDAFFWCQHVPSTADKLVIALTCARMEIFFVQPAANIKRVVWTRCDKAHKSSSNSSRSPAACRFKSGRSRSLPDMSACIFASIDVFCLCHVTRFVRGPRKTPVNNSCVAPLRLSEWNCGLFRWIWSTLLCYAIPLFIPSLILQILPSGFNFFPLAVSNSIAH